MASSTLAQDIAAHLSLECLRPTQAWLASFLQSIDTPNRPLHALKSTARFRMLASDITESVQGSTSPGSTNVFPPDIANGTVKERKVPGPVLVQVLDIEDIGHSRWGQVEAIEAGERGETTKGREMIRVVPNEEEQPGATVPGNSAVSAGPHKLVLQDAGGQQVYGLELSTVTGLSVSMNIGAKLLLKDVTVARGVALLETQNVQLLGGKIEKLDKAWRDGRKERLKAAAGMVERD